MKKYAVKPGDTLEAISVREGVPTSRLTVHDAAGAAKDASLALVAGDTVTIPARDPKTVHGAVSRQQSLKVQTSKVLLRLRLLVDGIPCEGARCTLLAGGSGVTKTGPEGRLELELPPQLTSCKLQVELPEKLKQADPAKVTGVSAPRVLTLQLGALPNKLAELQARLTNLGFHCDPIEKETTFDGILPARTKRAYLRFRKAFDVDGERQKQGNRPRKRTPKDGEQEGSRNEKLSALSSVDAIRREDAAALAKLVQYCEGERSWERPFSDEDKLWRSPAPPYHVNPGTRWNRINLLTGPEVVIDSHMHVNSGNCCPLPLSWQQQSALETLRPNRTQIEELALPLANRAHDLLQNVRSRARTLSEELQFLVDEGTALTEQEINELIVAVTGAMVLAGYLGKEQAHGLVSTIDQVGSLVDAMGADLRLQSSALRGGAETASELTQRLRGMVPDEARPLRLVKGATGLSGRLVQGVVNILLTKGWVEEEVGRVVANGVTEQAADVTQGVATGLDLASDLTSALARLARATAANMHEVRSELDRDIELVYRDACDLIFFVAQQVRRRLQEKLAGVRADVRDKTANLQKKLADIEAELDKYRTFIAISVMSTPEIARKSIEGNDEACKVLPRSASGERLSMVMAMPMDMDFGHIRGAEGKQVYEVVETRLAIDISLRALVPDPRLATTATRPFSSPTAEIVRLMRRPAPPPGDVAPKVLATQPTPAQGFVVEAKVVKEQGPFYYYRQYKAVPRSEVGQTGRPGASAPDDVELVEEARWLANDEFNVYQPYVPDQVADTLAAAVEQPLRVLPLYHYDPRRWREASGAPREARTIGGKKREIFPQAWDEPFKQYFADDSKRPFIGMKLYSALGYRPSDPRLPHQRDFYNECVSLDLPIVCHCSPGGLYSLERPLYVVEHAKRMKIPLDTLRKETEGLMHQRRVQELTKGRKDPVRWEEYWYSENYVSPFAWRKVLDDFPKLRLNLAHFGGDELPYTKWAHPDKDIRDDLIRKSWDDLPDLSWDEAIIKLAFEYPHFHVDISYFIFDARTWRFMRLLETYPHLRDKILFGSDWWMTELSGFSYVEFLQMAKRAIDGIDPELWQRFSWTNPARFYRLKENADAIANALSSGLSMSSRLPAEKAALRVRIDQAKSILKALRAEAHVH